MNQETTTLLIVPPNDEEAYLIAELGDRLGYRVHRSSQPHGARLEEEPGILEVVKESGVDVVVIVEMPGPDMEEKMRRLGKAVVVIDHHNYTDLERAYALDGSVLPSSLEQFLQFAGITDEQLEAWGYEVDLVRGIGLWDANYLWGVLEAGYTKDRVEAVIAFKDTLAKQVGAPDVDPINQQEAERVFAQREAFGAYFVVTSTHPTARIRSSLSRLFATTYWKRTPMILSERSGSRIYVQETDRAKDLFHHFGGFTFGSDCNWGYDNETELDQVTLAEVKEFLGEQR